MKIRYIYSTSTDKKSTPASYRQVKTTEKLDKTTHKSGTKVIK